MYAEDSFFTLTIEARLGLVLLSSMLGGLALIFLWRIVDSRNLVVRLILSVVCFTAFVWLTPQIYYVYYLAIFDALSWQVVIDWPPPASELIDLLLFRDRQNLSFHARGALGWTMLVLAVIKPHVSQFLAR
jgi:hypothetical protein